MSPPHVPVSAAALRRALKRHVWPARWTFQASTAAGLEALLAQEVRALLPDVPPHVTSGRVRLEAPFDVLYRLALGLRSADALRIRIADEAAATHPMLRDHLGRVAWRWWLPERCRFEIVVRSRRSSVRDDAAVERAVRQAIHDQGIDGSAAQSAEGGPAPTLKARVELLHDRVEVWLDVAGEPLHRRRGERWTVRGSLRETTAAALAMAAAADAADLIVDPFCGGGTVLEEAASWATGRCPGGERAFALQASPSWNEARMRSARREACSREVASPHLVGIDVAEAARAAATRNLERAGLASRSEVLKADARTVDLRDLAVRLRARTPLVLSNPPYGRRAQAHGAKPTALLAQVLQGVPGWRVGLTYPDPDALIDSGIVRDAHVVRFRMRGLANALVIGSVAEPG